MNKLQKIKYLLFNTFGIFVFSFAKASPIDDARSSSTGLARKAGYSTNNSQNLLFLIGTIIRYALSLIGIVFLVLTIINGFKWMTAGGNEEDVKKAKAGIMSAIKGLAIILIAYIITTLVQTTLSSITK